MNYNELGAMKMGSAEYVLQLARETFPSYKINNIIPWSEISAVNPAEESPGHVEGIQPGFSFVGGFVPGCRHLYWGYISQSTKINTSVPPGYESAEEDHDFGEGFNYGVLGFNSDYFNSNGITPVFFNCYVSYSGFQFNGWRLDLDTNTAMIPVALPSPSPEIFGFCSAGLGQIVTNTGQRWIGILHSGTATNFTVEMKLNGVNVSPDIFQHGAWFLIKIESVDDINTVEVTVRKNGIVNSYISASVTDVDFNVNPGAFFYEIFEGEYLITSAGCVEIEEIENELDEFIPLEGSEYYQEVKLGYSLSDVCGTVESEQLVFLHGGSVLGLGVKVTYDSVGLLPVVETYLKDESNGKCYYLSGGIVINYVGSC